MGERGDGKRLHRPSFLRRLVPPSKAFFSPSSLSAGKLGGSDMHTQPALRRRVGRMKRRKRRFGNNGPGVFPSPPPAAVRRRRTTTTTTTLFLSFLIVRPHSAPLSPRCAGCTHTLSKEGGREGRRTGRGDSAPPSLLLPCLPPFQSEAARPFSSSKPFLFQVLGLEKLEVVMCWETRTSNQNVRGMTRSSRGIC